MKTLARFFAIPLFVAMAISASGNNIIVENVSLKDQVAADHTVFIEFDLSWDNSWRTTSVPDNWDAAWVFCKYKVAGTDEWHHVYLHTTGHTAPSGVTISASADTAGAFVYRSANGSGSNDWNDLRLRWDYGFAGINDDAALEVKVFAVEMVYIQEGPFYLGDGISSDRFYMSTNNESFYHVTSEQNIPVDNTTGYLWAAGNIGSGTIPAAYPKGFNDFYLMKYEISQEQYVGFMNCLTRTQQITRTQTNISGTSVTNRYVMSNQASLYARNGIRCDGTLPASGPIILYCDYSGDGIRNQANDGQNIVCNFLSWPDLAAYLDWSGLRPMTELEFEKACRGVNNPVGGEYAWGNTLIHASTYTLSNTGEANELINSMPQDIGNCLYSGTYASLGWVLRCGIFAASSVNHTRIETGATYYGAMEMSGNVWELCVNAYYIAGRSFTGLHGNGELLPDGSADVSFWPGMNGNDSETYANGVYSTNGVTNQAGIGARGGESSYGITGLRISHRSRMTETLFITRTMIQGGRGARTAP